MYFFFFFFGFPVTFGLRNFHRGEGAFHSINFCESQSNAVPICTQKEVLIESILKRISGIFVVTLGLRNFHMWGEVKWTFLKNYSIIFLWNLENIILMQVTLCIQKEFWIESKLNGFFLFFEFCCYIYTWKFS